MSSVRAETLQHVHRCKNLGGLGGQASDLTPQHSDIQTLLQDLGEPNADSKGSVILHRPLVRPTLLGPYRAGPV